GIWVKLVFAWCLPALVLFGLFHARTTRGRLAAAIAGSWAVAFALPTLALLAAETTDHRRYYEIVSVGRLSADPDEAAVVGSRLGALLLHGAAVVPTTLQWPPIALDLLPALLAAAIVARGLLEPATRAAVGLWSLCAASVFAIAVSSGRADAPHHVVFA